MSITVMGAAAAAAPPSFSRSSAVLYCGLGFFLASDRFHCLRWDSRAREMSSSVS